MPIFERAKDGVNVQVAKIMEKYHGDLHKSGCTVDVLMASPTTSEQGEVESAPLKKNGYPCVALIKIVGLADRVAGLSDVMLKIDAEKWKEMSMKQKDALIDHELTHLIVKTDKDGNAKRDDQDRPKLQMKRHDYELGIFTDVIRRHERDSVDYQAFDAIAKTIGQMNLQFMDTVG